MLQKLNTHHKRSKLFISPVNSASALFGIRHFAGTVYYSAKGKQHVICMIFLKVFRVSQEIKRLVLKRRKRNFIWAPNSLIISFG